MNAPARRLGPLLAAVLAACGPGGASGELRAPRWNPLAHGARANDVRGGKRELASPSGRSFERVELDGREWIRMRFRPSDWLSGSARDGTFWKVPVQVLGTGRPVDGTVPQRLSGKGREFVFTGPRNDLAGVAYDAGDFYAGPEGVMLKLGPGERPPDLVTLDVYAEHGREADGRLRVAGERFSGDGFALWPGQRIERVVDVLPDSALRFATCVEPALLEQDGPTEGGEPVRFRVLLDGTPVFSSDVLEPHLQTLRNHVVPLPRKGRKAARLTFQVEGAAAYTSFLAPVVGPADPGTYAERPPGTRRPDLVVFLADTFRADNLAAYGRTDELTPYLDRFAERSRVFERAWSTSTYTLPAHFSMFAGVWPQQVGATSSARALPHAWTTLAEHLAANGYRTGAVTESVFVSRDYAFDQGFEWWDERHEPLELTLSRVRGFLDADDGRPIFLFVQTYRAHTPYVVQKVTRQRLGLPLDLRWSDLDRRLAELPEPREEHADYEPLVRGIEAFYRGASADLDRGFEVFHTDFVRRGLDRTGYLVVTSDHGEGFLEHDQLYHTGKVWEELVRVPLIVSGPDVGPGREPTAASLVDLAPSLCALAGVEPLAEWVGRPWLDPARGDGPVLLFQCESAPSTVGVVEGSRKLIDDQDALSGPGPAWMAFELGDDPGETVNVVGTAEWPAELRARFAPRLISACEPLVAPEGAAIDAAKAAELRAMGYTGGDE